MKQVETGMGVFEIVNDDNGVFNINDFEKRYVELFNRYEYIVGDYFQEQLRLKGFLIISTNILLRIQNFIF